MPRSGSWLSFGNNSTGMGLHVRLSGLTVLLVSRVRGSMTICLASPAMVESIAAVAAPATLLSLRIRFGGFQPSHGISHGGSGKWSGYILPDNRARPLRLTVRVLTVHPSGLASIFTSTAGCGIKVLASGSTEWPGYAFLAIQLGLSGSEGFRFRTIPIVRQCFPFSARFLTFDLSRSDPTEPRSGNTMRRLLYHSAGRLLHCMRVCVNVSHGVFLFLALPCFYCYPCLLRAQAFWQHYLPFARLFSGIGIEVDNRHFCALYFDCRP